MSSSRTQALISWLHDCLDAERSNRGIVKVTGSGVKRRRFLEGNDRALGDRIGWISVAPSMARDLAAAARLYRRECELLHGSWIIAGRLERRTVMAPVLLHRVLPDEVKDNCFPLDADGWRINPSLFGLLDLPDDFENELERLFAAEWPGREGMLGLVGLLGDSVPDLDASAASAYPRLAKPSDLEASSSTEGLRLYPASVLLLAERSVQVRGLLHEVRQLAGTDDRILSPPLKRLLGQECREAPTRRHECKTSWLPVHLAPAQSRLLESAASETLTLCYGPPGTGKTFTLAATAIEHALHEEAVLIVCRSQQAADVVTRTIDEMAGTDAMTLRAGNRSALAKLRDRIDLLLSGAVTPDASAADRAKRREEQLRKLLRVMEKRAVAFESSLKAALRRGRWFDPPGEAGFWVRFQQWRHARSVRDRPLLMEAAAELERLETERIALAREHLQVRRDHRLASLLDEPDVKPTLRLYRKALRKRGSGAQEAALAKIDLDVLLNVFPIWIVESDDVHRLLPLRAGLFPLVMIDEGSQCDLASALPVLQRGERALVGGDPKQLRHVSFLSEETLNRLADQQAAPIDAATREDYHFRRRSLIDVATDRASAIHFLSEHFRSRPELIAFSNRRFYGGQLRLMREVDVGEPRAPAFRVVRVDGRRGQQSGVNQSELEAAADFLGEWLTSQAEEVEASTVGFLSPLRAQADAFEAVLRERLGEDHYLRLLRRHSLVASTAHGFQGDERDVMLVSLGLTDDCPAATRRFVEREDVFNVSVTRARDRLVVFCSFDLVHFPADSLLRDWLGSLEREQRPETAAAADTFIEEVAVCLEERGFGCQRGRSIAGISIDLLVRDAKGGALALDLVGQRGRAGEKVPMQQLLLLQRAGLRLVPLGIVEWQVDRDRCLRAIERWVR